jgi:hypothetical protein
VIVAMNITYVMKMILLDKMNILSKGDSMIDKLLAMLLFFTFVAIPITTLIWIMIKAIFDIEE